MNITLLTVGKTDVPWVKDSLALYADRLHHYVPFTVSEIPQLKNVSALSRDQIKALFAQAEKNGSDGHTA